jgi:hypothetical protein
VNQRRRPIEEQAAVGQHQQQGGRDRDKGHRRQPDLDRGFPGKHPGQRQEDRRRSQKAQHH